jgi:hypothetical protein
MKFDPSELLVGFDLSARHGERAKVGLRGDSSDGTDKE